jgi:general stress protein 26
MPNDTQEARDKLWTMIKKHRFAMLTTRHEDALRSRPMTTIDHAADDSLWFFAKADSATAEELQQHGQVCLSYSDTSKPDFVSVSGDAAVVSDVAKKRALWNKAVQAWFPEGASAACGVLGHDQQQAGTTIQLCEGNGNRPASARSRRAPRRAAGPPFVSVLQQLLIRSRSSNCRLALSPRRELGWQGRQFLVVLGTFRVRGAVSVRR